MLSGEFVSLELQEAEREGYLVLHKPIDPVVLRALLSTWLDSGAPTQRTEKMDRRFARGLGQVETPTFNECACSADEGLDQLGRDRQRRDDASKHHDQQHRQCRTGKYQHAGRAGLASAQRLRHMKPQGQHRQAVLRSKEEPPGACVHACCGKCEVGFKTIGSRRHPKRCQSIGTVWWQGCCSPGTTPMWRR